jgi:hypothetical protein
MPNIIYDPPTNWVERLHPGHKVWLPEEQKEAEIDFAYEPAEPGYRVGRIGLRKSGGWYVGLDGEGLNGQSLIQPLEGNLPDNPEPLPEPLVRQMQRAIERLDNRLRTLENGLMDEQQLIDRDIISGWDILEANKSNPVKMCVENPCSYCNGTGKAIKSFNAS